MRSLLLTSSAILLLAGLSAGEARAQAECPASIDAFTREYEEAKTSAAAGEALSPAEEAELLGLRRTAEQLYAEGNLETCAEVMARANRMLDSTIAPAVVAPDELIGMEVRNSEDEGLGEIEDVMLDPVSGRIAFILVEHGGFLGIGSNLFPVPWRSVTFVPGAESVLLEIDENRLENAPRYIEEDATSQQRRAWLVSVHNYYGATPYWQDSVPGAALAYGSGETGTQPEGKDGAPEAGAAPAVGEAPPAAADAEEPGTRADLDPAGSGEEDTPQQGAAVTAAPSEAESARPAGAGEDRLALLLERMERIEQELQQGPGDELRQSIRNIEEQVSRLAERVPESDVGQAIAQLSDRVESLAERMPDADVGQALQDLRERVGVLSERDLGAEMSQAVARLEDRIESLADRIRGVGEPRQGMAPTEGAARADRTGTDRTQPARTSGDAGPDRTEATGTTTGTARTSGAETATGRTGNVSEDSAAPGTGTGAADAERDEQARGGDAGSGRRTIMVPVIRMAPAGTAGTAEDGEQRTTGQAATAGEGAAEGGGATATGTAAEQRATGQAATTGEQAAEGERAAGSRPADEQRERETDAGRSAAGTEGDNRQAATRTGTAGDEARTSETQDRTGADGAFGSCQEGIGRLEEDLEQAEALDLSIDNARIELDRAQAMLERGSEALCRAALRRAQRDLVALGYEPTTTE